MVDKERRLGRGLESLISAARDRSLSIDVIRRSGHRVQAVGIEAIEPNPFQPRKHFPIEELNELIGSIREHGLMQPVVVRRVGTEDRYQLVAGERRWRACRELGNPTIEAVVVDADDQKMLVWALIENIQRQNLGPLELALAFQQMVSSHAMTQEEVARIVGMSRPAVTNLLRLLELPQEVKELVSRGTVSMGAARALLAIEDRERQTEIARQVDAGRLTVRQVEELARRPARTQTAGAALRTADPNLEALREEIEAVLGSRVRIRGSIRRGQIVVPYHSPQELDALVRRLRALDASTTSEAAEELEGDSFVV